MSQYVFGIGLPRCGGQTLQQCLSILLNGRVVHSPGNNWESVDGCVGAVEVFAPLNWLALNYPESIFIYNYRDPNSWYWSCESVYPKSGNYNHPLWKYPLSQFYDYFVEYYTRWLGFKDKHPDRCIEVDLIKYPNWIQLCDGLGLKIPIGKPFPNVDRVKRPASHGLRQLYLSTLDLSSLKGLDP